MHSPIYHDHATFKMEASPCNHFSPDNQDFCSSLETLVTSTVEQLSDKRNVTLAQQYLESCVEGIPPSDGDSWRQHEAMVAAGMCEAGRRHKIKNRYRDELDYGPRRWLVQVETVLIECIILKSGPNFAHLCTAIRDGISGGFRVYLIGNTQPSY